MIKCQEKVKTRVLIQERIMKIYKKVLLVKIQSITRQDTLCREYRKFMKQLELNLCLFVSCGAREGARRKKTGEENVVWIK